MLHTIDVSPPRHNAAALLATPNTSIVLVCWFVGKEFVDRGNPSGSFRANAPCGIRRLGLEILTGSSALRSFAHFLKNQPRRPRGKLLLPLDYCMMKWSHPRWQMAGLSFE